MKEEGRPPANQWCCVRGGIAGRGAGYAAREDGRDRRLKHARFRMMREDGREMLGREKRGAAGYAKPPCPLKGWREGRLCKRQNAHGRREIRRRDRRLKHTRFGMRREDGREMLGVRKKRGAAGYAKPPCPLKGWRDGRLCERHSAHGRREARVAGQAAETYAFRMRREDGREMLGREKRSAAGYAKPPCPLKGWRDGRLCERHSAHGRREARVTVEACAFQDDVGGWMGARRWVAGKTRRGGICKAALPAERMAGWAVM